MKEYYELKGNCIVPSTPEASNITVYSVPTEVEKKELCRTLRLDPHGLESALDPDEISRVEFTADHLYLIWKRPNTAVFKAQLKFEVSSLGIYLKSDRLIFILGESTPPFDTKKFQEVTSLNGVMLKTLLDTVHHFLGHLKAMRLINAELQGKLNASMENQYLLQMFNLSESLIYYLNALEANASALTKLRASAEKVPFSKEDLEELEDIIIDHQQCNKQVQIYSSVVSGLMDARGNIINNNMNVLLRNLTIINVVFLPLNLIASVGGMSEYTHMTSGAMNWEMAYALFLAGMAVLGIITWVLIVRQIKKQRVV